jgi:hypothetical protein
MADNAADILKKWRGHVPPEVSKEDVEKVVAAYFPKTHHFTNKTGSHWLLVDDPVLKALEESGFDTRTTQGKISFSLVQGKRVKAYLIKDLLAAIKIKEDYEQMMSERAKQEKKK